MFLAPNVAVELSSKHVTEWRQVWKKKNSKVSAANSAVQTSVKWRPPEPGCLKINVDASVRENEAHYSIGMVIRDHEGKFLMGKTLKVEGKVSVLEAESVGVLEALLWSVTFPNIPITIESDSLLTVSAVKKDAEHYLELGQIFRQCREILASRSNLGVVFVKKLANNVAHGMARLPCALNSYNILMSPPQILLETIMYDSSCS